MPTLHVPLDAIPQTRQAHLLKMKIYLPVSLIPQISRAYGQHMQAIPSISLNPHINHNISSTITPATTPSYAPSQCPQFACLTDATTLTKQAQGAHGQHMQAIPSTTHTNAIHSHHHSPLVPVTMQSTSRANPTQSTTHFNSHTHCPTHPNHNLVEQTTAFIPPCVQHQHICPHLPTLALIVPLTLSPPLAQHKHICPHLPTLVWIIPPTFVHVGPHCSLGGLYSVISRPSFTLT